MESVAREHRTVSRVTTILEVAGQSPGGVKLGELAAALAAPKSSIHALVKGLVATGYLEPHDGSYLLGPAVDVLLRPMRVADFSWARRSLEGLQSRWDETVMFCKLVGDSVVYADVVESSQMIRYSPPRNGRRPLYPTSSGKCFLAHFSTTSRDRYIRDHITEDNRGAVAKELADVHDRGFAYNVGETLADVFGVSSPIILSGRVVAVFAVAGPRARMEGQMAAIAADVHAEAAKAAGRAIAKA